MNRFTFSLSSSCFSLVAVHFVLFRLFCLLFVLGVWVPVGFSSSLTLVPMLLCGVAEGREGKEDEGRGTVARGKTKHTKTHTQRV